MRISMSNASQYLSHARAASPIIQQRVALHEFQTRMERVQNALTSAIAARALLKMRARVHGA